MKISWGIVKRQMPVLPDADESDIYGCRSQSFADAADNFGRITVAIEQVIISNSHVMNQAFEKIFAKAGGMTDGKPDVLVEMKHLDSLPVDVFSAGQRVQKIQLGRSCCGDDSCPAVIADRIAYCRGRLLRSGFAERELVFKNLNNHAAISSHADKYRAALQ